MQTRGRELGVEFGVRWGCWGWVGGTGGVGITPGLIFQVSQPPPGRQLAVSGLCQLGHHSVPPPLTPETLTERGSLQYSGTPKIVPGQMLGCICHGSPRWHSNYLVGKLRPAQGGAGVSRRRVSSLWPLGSLSRGARTPIFLCPSLLPLPTNTLPPRQPLRGSRLLGTQRGAIL